MVDLAGFGHTLSIWFLPVIFAITLHEAAHAWAAWKLGDDTAKSMGRLSFNPIRHVDPFGTLILPGMLLVVGAPFLFGWAKPVPVAFHRLGNPKRDMIFVALAGPAINIVMALAAAAAMHLFIGSESEVALWIWQNLDNALLVNVVLACFNMLPLLPLDGGRVLTGLLPLPLARQFARTEPYGLFILLGIIFVIPLVARELGFAINPMAMVLLPVIQFVHGLVLLMAGWW